MAEASAAASSQARKGLIFASLLSFVAGYVDACGFIALFGLFTAHVTGNFILIGASLVSGHAGLIGKLLAMPTFVLAVAATRLIVLAFERHKASPLRFLIILQALLLTLFMLAGWSLPAVHDADSLASILTGLAGVAAMAIQNAFSRLQLAALGPTTMMTGNVTQAVIDLVDLFRPSAAAAALARLKHMVPPIIGFGAAAAVAAFAYMQFSYLCLLLPIALLGVLTAMPFQAKT